MSSDDSSIPIETQFPEKECYKCGVVKPRSEYYPDKRIPDGLASRCKKCSLEYLRWRKENPGMKQGRYKREIFSKRCKGCDIEKPLSEFYPRKDCRGGVMTHCKRCMSEHKKARYATDPKMRERHEQYRFRSRERGYFSEYNRRPEVKARARDKHRVRMATDPEYRKALREYHARPEVKEKARQYRREWYWNGNGKAIDTANKNNRRSQALKNGGTFTKDDVLLMFKNQKGKCHWCKKKLPKNYHVDHVIPLSRGGRNDPSNLVLSCPHCNNVKHNKLPHELGWRLF